MVTMTHPDLPDREIEVHEQTVEIHEAAGWVVADEPAVYAPAPSPEND